MVRTALAYDADWQVAHEWYVRAAGDDLDVRVKFDDVWTQLFEPDGNGQGALRGGPADGAVGVAGTGLDAAAVVCDTFACGYDPDGDGYVAQVMAEDTFDGGSLTVAPLYDAAGNLTDDGVYLYEYDAWNRLVGVQRLGPTSAPQTIATYRYDGLGHRVYKKVENSGELNREEYFYYNKNWQLLEIADATNKAKQQFVWGSQYIDEAICMDVDTDSDGDCTDLADTGTNPAGGARRFFYMQDANWNVVALAETTSSGPVVRERYEYDPYGTVRIYKGVPDTGSAELRQVAGQSLSWLNANLPGNPHMYCGYFQDSETDKYHVRHRMLGPDRWLQRDPLGTGLTTRTFHPLSLMAQYANGANLSQYAGAGPIDVTDPSGLIVIDGHECKNRKQRPGYVMPAPNGCGSKDFDVPDQWICDGFVFEWTTACNKHDNCYAKCNSDKGKCDKGLGEDMATVCMNWFKTLNRWQRALHGHCLNECLAQAGKYHIGVQVGGGKAYEESQQVACTCDCPDKPSPPPPWCIEIAPGVIYCPDLPLNL